MTADRLPRHRRPLLLLPLLAPLVLLAALAGCGGNAEDGRPVVSTMQATGARYGGTALITVSGRNLLGTTRVAVEGPCESLAPVGLGSDDTQQYTCAVRGLGEVRAFVISSEGPFIGQLTLQVPAPVVNIATSMGTIEVELDPGHAPVTVQNFLAYVNAGFYRNVIVHRVVANRLLQAGGFTSGLAPKLPTRPAIKLESNNGLVNLRGTIAMARTDAPDSASAQWFINVIDNPAFDFVDAEQPGYAVFGKVSSGLPVVDAIGAVPTRGDAQTGLADVPETEIVISAATQVK